MKNQYFGDINDYRKYGLLRAISFSTHLKTFIAWMLTPDDGSTDGKFIHYLQAPGKWSHYDPILFSVLQQIMSTQTDRKVAHLKNSTLLPNSNFYSEIVPDHALSRQLWFTTLQNQSQKYDLIFLDPDNGLEVKSKRYGNKNSCKYLYWREVTSIWQMGKSLLIYQHFIREKRKLFIDRLLTTLQQQTDGSIVEAFFTPHVVFLLALQPNHHHFHSSIIKSIQEKWEGQFQVWSRKQNI